MSLWLIRAGRNGEQEEDTFKYNVAAIGWFDLPDLSAIKAREELAKLFEEVYPGEKKFAIINQVAQLWAFIKRIQVGDLVILPQKLTSSIAIGKVTGPYKCMTDVSPNIKHVRPIEWLKTEIPRTAFGQDLLYSFGAFMTVCQIQRNNAEERVKAILEGKSDTGIILDTDEPVGEEGNFDIEQAARDQIVKYINRKFKGHGLERLVEAVLRAQGYVTKKSDAGPDGGIDILAGSGPMGFDNPRICVQVKSSDSPTDVHDLRSLQGAMKNFGADQCLFVSWSGFKRPAIDEARRNFFTVRLWDSGDILNEIFRNYDKLPDDLQAELPLKRIWGLVDEE